MQVSESRSPSRPVRKVLKWIARIVAVTFALALVACLAAATQEFFAEKRDRSQFPVQGKRVDIGGYALTLNCTGEGRSTVILESGWSMPGVSWSLVQPEVARFARVCSYDRAGYGWSDEGPMPRSSDEIARELHTLLHNAGISPPYVLAGHSLGGYITRCFRGMYPNEVAGMVLIDPSQEDMNAAMPPDLMQAYQDQIGQIRRFTPFFALLARLGILRRIVHSQTDNYHLTPDLLEEISYLSSQPKAFRAMASELDAGLNLDPDQARHYGTAPGSLGDLPLIVLSARYESQDSSINGLNEFLKTVVTDLHPRTAHLSTRGKQIIVDASHFIPFEKPEAVIAAIQEVHTASAQRTLR